MTERDSCTTTSALLRRRVERRALSRGRRSPDNSPRVSRVQGGEEAEQQPAADRQRRA